MSKKTLNPLPFLRLKEICWNFAQISIY